MRSYGLCKSDMSGVPVFSQVSCNRLPEKYDISSKTRPVIDQGSQNICASICVGDAVTWNARQKGNNITIHTDYFFKKRKDKSVDGMTIKEALEIASKDFGIKKWGKIQDKDFLKHAIIANGPVILGMPYYGGEPYFWRNTGSLIGYHAVVATGYDKDGIIIKNSWGWGFGNQGFVTIPYSDWNSVIEVWTIIC